MSGEFGTKGDANTFIGTSYYMAPERITGQSYTITSDVWSLGVTLLEVAQHRFPFPADGTEMQPRAGLIDLLTYIVRQPIPKLKDEEPAEGEEGKGVKWSEGFKYFIECWYVRKYSFLLLYSHSPHLSSNPRGKYPKRLTLRVLHGNSLEREPSRRATPWRMLEHPWMVEMHGKKVNMELFLRQVWDWRDEEK